jgi:hypothetical protein
VERSSGGRCDTCGYWAREGDTCSLCVHALLHLLGFLVPAGGRGIDHVCGDICDILVREAASERRHCVLAVVDLSRDRGLVEPPSQVLLKRLLEDGHDIVQHQQQSWKQMPTHAHVELVEGQGMEKCGDCERAERALVKAAHLPLKRLLRTDHVHAARVACSAVAGEDISASSGIPCKGWLDSIGEDNARRRVVRKLNGGCDQHRRIPCGLRRESAARAPSRHPRRMQARREVALGLLLCFRDSVLGEFWPSPMNAGPNELGLRKVSRSLHRPPPSS